MISSLIVLASVSSSSPANWDHNSFGLPSRHSGISEDLPRFKPYRDKVASLLGKSPSEVQAVVSDPVQADKDGSFNGGVTWTLSVEGLNRAFNDALPTQVHFVDGKAESYRIVVNGHVAKRGAEMASSSPSGLEMYDPNENNAADKMFYKAPVNARASDAKSLGLLLDQATFYLPHSGFRIDDRGGRSTSTADWLEMLERAAVSSVYGEAKPFYVSVPVAGSNDMILLQSLAAPKPTYGADHGSGELVGILRGKGYDKDGAEVDTSRYVVNKENWELGNWYWCAYVGRRQACPGAHPNIPSPSVRTRFNHTIKVADLRSAAEGKYK